MLADLYRANASAVYFVCHFLLRNPEDAADAMQEVFLKAVESLRGRSTANAARAWLLSAAQDHCLEMLRRHHRVDRIATSAGTDSADVADPETAVVERDLVSAVLKELRVRERHALWLWAVESRSLAEIANDLGLSYTAVQQLLFRARRHAASVAARVAALLGLLQLGRALRRASQAYQLVLLAAVVPVVLASVPSTSAPNPSLGSPPSESSSLGRAPAGAGKGLDWSNATARAGTVALPGAPLSLPSVALKADAPAFDSAISTLDRSIRQLTGTIGTASASKAVLTGQLGLPPTPTPPTIVP